MENRDTGSVAPLGRLPFVTDALLALLRREAREELVLEPGPSRPAPGRAGRALAALAVSPKLRAAVSRELDADVEPTYEAVYLYDPPGSRQPLHRDRDEYEIVVHLVLEHELPADGSPGSALVVHLEEGPRRIPIEPGEAVALRGRETLHAWEPLRDDEERILTALGFASRA